MRVVASLAAVVLGVAAAPVHAQTEWDLKQAFEGKFVIVKMDMPATQRGVDLYPDRQPSVDFSRPLRALAYCLYLASCSSWRDFTAALTGIFSNTAT